MAPIRIRCAHYCAHHRHRALPMLASVPGSVSPKCRGGCRPAETVRKGVRCDKFVSAPRLPLGLYQH
jgi:hypothetical protein